MDWPSFFNMWRNFFAKEERCFHVHIPNLQVDDDKWLFSIQYAWLDMSITGVKIVETLK